MILVFDYLLYRKTNADTPIYKNHFKQRKHSSNLSKNIVQIFYRLPNIVNIFLIFKNYVLSIHSKDMASPKIYMIVTHSRGQGQRTVGRIFFH